MLDDNKEAKRSVRDKIIEIASCLFRHYGFRKTTLDDIAEEAKRKKSSIYYYFENKEAIFRTVIEKEANEMANALEVAVKNLQDPKDKVRAFFTEYMRELKENVNFYKAIRIPEVSGSEFVDDIRKNYEEREYNTMVQILESGVKEGCFAIETPKYMATIIVMVMRSFETALFDGKEDMDRIKERVDHAIRLLFYGMVKR